MGDVIKDLNRAKVVFQQRTVVALMTETNEQHAARIDRQRKEQERLILEVMHQQTAREAQSAVTRA